ncbi:cytochrome P450 [Calocera cornea HHB12733]|uniref:Cytochrome P450 n=1 Tax=Calocera cornea HHB12733 TaxID=1353952 RepID=A0A165IU78_9BASI|nr:cytochrome P450 [Calocera cornea HHB12733]
MHSAIVSLLDLFAVALGVWLVYKITTYGSREKGLPPGPPTTLILGNIPDIPTKKAFLKLVEWAREYGEIYSIKLGHKTTVVLNSPAAVQAVMEKGSRVTQDRPKMWLFDHYIYDHDHLIFSSVPSKVNQLRRIFTTFLNQTTAQRYLPIQEAESSQLLYDIMINPDSFFKGVKRFTISIMFSLSYGVRAPKIESPLPSLFYEAVDMLNELVADVSALLDFVPLLRILPGWMINWRKRSDRMKAQERQLTSELMERVYARRKSNTSTNSFIEQILDNPEEFRLSENMMHTLPLLNLQAGADTTASAILSVLLLLVGQEKVLEKAHSELDTVVGRDRLPTLADMEQLPYIRAIIKESERFRPTNPLGFPHATTEDQMYAGYLIPAGATVMVNTWALGHDPHLFPAPETFSPERWLDPSVNYPDTWPFGVGRRICPGMYLAKNSVAVVISRLLWAFDIQKKVNPSTGIPFEVDTLDYAEGLVLCPNPFEANFILRSKEHGDTIKHELRGAIPHLETYEIGMEHNEVEYVEEMRKAV